MMSRRQQFDRDHDAFISLRMKAADFYARWPPDHRGYIVRPDEEPASTAPSPVGPQTQLAIELSRKLAAQQAGVHYRSPTAPPPTEPTEPPSPPPAAIDMGDQLVERMTARREGRAPAAWATVPIPPADKPTAAHGPCMTTALQWIEQLRAAREAAQQKSTPWWQR